MHLLTSCAAQIRDEICVFTEVSTLLVITQVAIYKVTKKFSE